MFFSYLAVPAAISTAAIFCTERCSVIFPSSFKVNISTSLNFTVFPVALLLNDDQEAFVALVSLEFDALLQAVVIKNDAASKIGRSFFMWTWFSNRTR